MPPFLRSRRAILATLTAALLVPIAVFGYFAMSLASDALERQVMSQSESAADLGRQVVEGYFTQLARHVEGYARRHACVEAVKTKDPAVARQELACLLKEEPRFDRCLVADAEGVVWANWPAEPAAAGTNVVDRDWYAGVKALGRTYVSEVYQVEPRVRLAAVVTPVRCEDGATAGYLVGHLPVEALAAWTSTIQLAAGGKLSLLDKRGALVDAAWRGVNDVEGEPSWQLHAALAGESEPWVGIDPVTGEEALLCARAVDPWGWTVLTHVPTSRTFEPVRALRWAFAGLAGVLFVVLVALGFACFRALRSEHVQLVHVQDVKDRLTTALVHDLRNPLTALIGNIDLASVHSHRLPPDAVTSLRQARSSAKRLAEMSNTLVDIVRMEDARMPVHLAAVDVNSVVSLKAAEYAARAQAADVEVRVVAPERSAHATADPALLTRIVENLLVNALKHTPAQGIVTLTVTDRSSDEGRVVVRVEDTGEGIPAEQADRLFKKHGRVADRPTGASNDTGLGLLFCRMAVDLMGGSIRLEGRPAEGCAFSVSLPAAESTGEAALEALSRL